MNLSNLSDEMLLANLTALVGCQREITARFVAHLAEIEDRRLHLVAGFSSMFEFCEEKLRMSPGEAYRRILAARLARRFPVIYPLITAGAVHLTALELLRERLTEENHAELLEAVSWKKKCEIERILAARFPKPDVPSAIRKLPEPLAMELGESDPEAGALPQPPPPPPPAARPRIDPLSESRYKVQFTASAELRE